MPGKDLGYKPSVVQQAKFDYSPLGKVSNKRLDNYNQKEGLLKSVKNIKDKNEKLLKVLKEQSGKQPIISKQLTSQTKLLITQGLNLLVRLKSIFSVLKLLSLGNLAKNIYDGNAKIYYSFKHTRILQRKKGDSHCVWRKYISTA